MKYLLTGVVGLFIVLDTFNLYAAHHEQSVRIDEILRTTRIYTKGYTLEGQGFGQGGVPVTQTHTFDSVSVVNDKFTSTQKELSETEIAQAVLQSKAVTISVIGKPTTQILQAGEYLSEVRKTFTLMTTHPGLELSLEGAELLEGKDHQPRLKLLIGLKNLTHQPLNLTEDSFKKGDFWLAETSPKTTAVVVGRVIYDLPELNGTYTLELPAHLPQRENANP